MSMEDEPTQFGTPNSRQTPSYWNTPTPENNSAPTPPPQKKQRTPVGIVTALIAVVAALSVAVVVLIMQRGNSGPVAASTKTSAQLTQGNSSSSGPMSSTAALKTSSNTASQVSTSASSQTRETSSSSPASTSDTTDAFPAGSRAVCGSDTNDTDSDLYPLTNPRVRIGSEIANSCGFVAEVASDVDNQVVTNPSLPSFSLTVQTPRDKSWHNLQCSRVDHLSTCVIDDKPGHVIYVQDK